MRTTKDIQNIRVLYGENFQLCNRLWSYVGHILWAIKNNKTVYVLTWIPDIFDFGNILRNKYIRFSFYYVPFFNLRIVTRRPIDALFQRFLYSSFFRNMIQKMAHRNPSVFLKEWPPSYSLEEDFITYKPILRDLFQPNLNVRSSVEPLFQKLKEQFGLIIGIHIRRGDYASFMNGKYFYSFEKYASLMNNLLQIYNDKKICFYIASVEPVPVELFSPFDTVSIDKATAVQDLYALSLCDRLVGPPSSFSRWASFINDVPIHFIMNQEDFISSDTDFTIVKDQDYLMNGTFMPVDLAKIE